MKKNTKIGILTYFDTINYGAALQAFALQQAIKAFGAEPEFLNYIRRKPDSLKKGKSIFRTILNNPLGVLDLILHPRRTIQLRRRYKSNHIGFANFSNMYFNCSRELYYTYEDFLETNNKYAGFVTGSDMVWTPIGQNLEVYFLQFADKDKRFSYAPSMTGCHTYTKQDADRIKQYLNDMNIISCREQEGVDYVKEITGRNATLVVDPTLLYTKEKWKKELNIGSQKPTKPYILCYTFGGLPKKIEKEVYRIAKDRQMDVRYIPMNHSEMYKEFKLGHHGPYGPREFVEHFINASFCVTNTFHGFLFSLISENPFVVVHRENGNAWKANETRISNLLDILDLKERFIESNANIEDHFLTLDYCNVNEKLRERRETSLLYLKNIVDKALNNEVSEKQNIIKNVRDISVKHCTGCGLCVSICPFEAISMIENQEGFLIPNVDNIKCKECGRCAKDCPSIHRLEKKHPLETKLCLSKDKLLGNSASGGLFITMAKYFIQKLNGVVYGVVMDSDFSCHHKEATIVEDLIPMQNSKYVQSIVGDCYEKAKQRLDNGTHVLFSGTPCQIAAFKALLKKDYCNLLTMDVICHGVPNQRYWKTYINNYQNKGLITSYIFRNRSNKITWNPTSKEPRKSTQEATIIASWGIDHIPAQQDPYYGPFVRCESYRMSCYYCYYADKERVADITMGDCDSDRLYPDFHPYESKSIALINTKKGIEMWKSIRSFMDSIDLNYKKEIEVNTCLNHPSICPIVRNTIYQDLMILSWDEFSKKYSIKPHKLEVVFQNAYYMIKR